MTTTAHIARRYPAPTSLARAIALIAFTMLVLAFAPADSARSATVAYIDGNEVWVANLNGSSKTRLSAGEADWRDVAQSDDGYVVGVRLQAGKIAQLSNFTVWDPNGNVVHFGPLAGNSNGSFAYPLSLDLTPGGGLIIYGFSQYIYGFPVGTLIEGHYLLPSATRAAPVPEPLKNSSIQYPTLVGNRVVGSDGDHTVLLQDTGGTGSTTFNPWMSIDDPAVTDDTVRRADVAATGNIAAVEVEYARTAPTPNDRAIFMSKWAGLGGAYVDDCRLDVDAKAIQPSLSQDGTAFAWQDGGGVKVAGVPSFNGAPVCQLTAPPVTISPSGSFPSIGGFNIPALVTPTLSAPKSANLAKAIKKGLTVKVSSKTGGTATLKLTVKPKQVGKRGKKPIMIASAKTKLPAGGAVKSVKLKFTRTGKKLKKKLKGDKAVLTLSVGGVVKTSTVKLK